MFLGAAKPVIESGLDIAPNSPWSPRFGESTQGRMFSLSMSSGAGAKEWIREEIIACGAGWDVH
jgi:hypothetical protein